MYKNVRAENAIMDKNRNPFLLLGPQLDMGKSPEVPDVNRVFPECYFGLGTQRLAANFIATLSVYVIGHNRLCVSEKPTLPS